MLMAHDTSHEALIGSDFHDCFYDEGDGLGIEDDSDESLT